MGVDEEERNISYPIGLKYCSVITTPLTVGMWKKNKVTYLPEKSSAVRRRN